MNYEEEEYHNNRLNNLCRLCCKKIIQTKGYFNAKLATDYVEEIEKLFHHNVKEDFQAVHPKHLCDSCRRKLERLKQNEQQVETAKMAIFKPHSPGCKLCFGRKSLDKHLYSLNFLPNVEIQTIPVYTSQTPVSFDDVISSGKEKQFQLINIDNDFCMLAKFKMGEAGSIHVTFSLKFYKDLSWKLFVFNHEVSLTSQTLSSISRVITSENKEKFFNDISKLKICPGNKDFPEIIASKLSQEELNFYSKDKEVSAKIETEYMNDIATLNTIRSVKCEVVIPVFGNRCDSCQKFRKNLSNISIKLQNNENDVVAVKKNTPNVHLSKEQLILKVTEYQKDRRSLMRHKEKMEKKIELLLHKESVRIDPETQDIISNVMETSKPDFDENSPKFLLWEQQKKINNLKNRSSMRWHPVMIRWCLSIYLKSPGAYEHLRRSGFIELPHRTTLNKYTGFTDIGTGFNPDILSRLRTDVKYDELKEYAKETILLFDEMKIKSSLVYSKNTGKLIGFTELGDINEELDEFSRKVTGKETKQLATHVLCIMARSLLGHYSYPIAYFSSCGFSSDQLFPVIWQSVRVLESIGFRVSAMVSDGASPNRRFFRLHEFVDGSNKSLDGVVYWSWNRFDTTRKIYFFSDVPHLMKTLRNNFENSHGHNKTRNLMLSELEISWQHIVDRYTQDLGMNRGAPGLRMLPKLTEDHITLSPRLRMRVYLAVQVLSKSVADGLKQQNRPYTASTEKFIRKCDTFFDCLNVTTMKQGQISRKPALYPYREIDDWRFKWLKEDFLAFINNWKEETDNIPHLTQDMKSRLCLSYQTIEGLRITVHSFCEFVPYLLQKGADYFLSDKLNQDPIEEHFGRIRMRGGSLDNPTLEEYGYMNRKCIVAKAEMIQVMRGNTRGRIRENVKIDIHDTRQLPKRPKK